MTAFEGQRDLSSFHVCPGEESHEYGFVDRPAGEGPLRLSNLVLDTSLALLCLILMLGAFARGMGRAT
jgi:hypothetical protein